MEDSMIDMPNLVLDEKLGNKRVRDGEEEITTGRLEKRPSGILGVNGVGDYIGDGGDEGGESGSGGNGSGGGGGGIIDTFFSNVFHKSESGVKEDEEDGVEVKKDVFDVEVENGGGGGGGGNGGGEDGGGGGGDGEDGEGGGVINSFFSNIFHRNETRNGDSGGGGGAGGDGSGDGGGVVKDLNEEKLEEKKDIILDELAGKDVEGGQKLKMKPDDYSERVFFLNNN